MKKVRKLIIALVLMIFIFTNNTFATTETVQTQTQTRKIMDGVYYNSESELQITGEQVATDEISKKINTDRIPQGYEEPTVYELIGNISEGIELIFDVETEKNGLRVCILHKTNEGTYKDSYVDVEDGKVTISVTELGVFAIAPEMDGEITIDEDPCFNTQSKLKKGEFVEIIFSLPTLEKGVDTILATLEYDTNIFEEIEDQYEFEENTNENLTYEGLDNWKVVYTNTTNNTSKILLSRAGETSGKAVLKIKLKVRDNLSSLNSTTVSLKNITASGGEETGDIEIHDMNCTIGVEEFYFKLKQDSQLEYTITDDINAEQKYIKNVEEGITVIDLYNLINNEGTEDGEIETNAELYDIYESADAQEPIESEEQEVVSGNVIKLEHNGKTYIYEIVLEYYFRPKANTYTITDDNEIQQVEQGTTVQAFLNNIETSAKRAQIQIKDSQDQPKADDAQIAKGDIIEVSYYGETYTYTISDLISGFYLRLKQGSTLGYEITEEPISKEEAEGDEVNYIKKIPKDTTVGDLKGYITNKEIETNATSYNVYPNGTTSIAARNNNQKIENGYEIRAVYDTGNITRNYIYELVIEFYLESDEYEIDQQSKTIAKVTQGTTVSAFLDNINTNADIDDITIKDKDGNPKSANDPIAKDDQVIIPYYGENYTYTIQEIQESFYLRSVKYTDANGNPYKDADNNDIYLYKIDMEEDDDGQRIISFVRPKTTVEQFIANLETNGTIQEVINTPEAIALKGRINAKDKNETFKGYVGTGARLIITYQGKSHEFYIAVVGDVNQNGLTGAHIHADGSQTRDLDDSSRIAQALVGMQELSKLQKIAANVNFDSEGKVTVTDYSIEVKFASFNLNDEHGVEYQIKRFYNIQDSN